MPASAIPAGLARRYYAQLGRASEVLDVGCGPGAFGALKPEGGPTLHGVDLDSRALAVAVGYEALHVVDLDREPLPYEDETFDGSLVKDVLEHLQDPGAVLADVARVMKPGAPLVASVVVHHPRRVWDDPTHVRGFTRQAAVRLVESSGFAVNAVWLMGPVPGSERFGFIDAVPRLLSVPGLGHLWAASWEVLAVKRRERLV